MTDFGNVPVHVVSADCNGNDTSFTNCVDVDYYDIYTSYGSGEYILDQVVCTMHAGLICEGKQKLNILALLYSNWGRLAQVENEHYSVTYFNHVTAFKEVSH